MVLPQTVPLAMLNCWPEGALSVEKGVMSVGYYFSSASSLVMRVRQVVFASASAFSRPRLCVLDRMEPGEAGVGEPAAMAGADGICSQKSQQRPHQASPMQEVRHPTQVVTLGSPCGPCFRDNLAPGSNSLTSLWPFLAQCPCLLTPPWKVQIALVQ